MKRLFVGGPYHGRVVAVEGFIRYYEVTTIDDAPRAAHISYEDLWRPVSVRTVAYETRRLSIDGEFLQGVITVMALTTLDDREVRRLVATLPLSLMGGI